MCFERIVRDWCGIYLDMIRFENEMLVWVERSIVWKATWSNSGECGSCIYFSSMQLPVWSEIKVFSCTLAKRVHVMNITIMEKLLEAYSDYIQDWVSHFSASPVMSMWRWTAPIWRLDFVIRIIGATFCFVRFLHLLMMEVTISVNQWCQVV